MITANTEGDEPSRLPYTNERESDANAANESGADRCAANPQQLAFSEWHKGLAATTSSCGGYGTWLTHASGDAYYAFLGACGDSSVHVPYTFTAAAWDDIWVGEGAQQVSAVPQEDGKITKTFSLNKNTPSGDRVAFFIQGKHGIDAATIGPNMVVGSNCDSSCTIYEKSGNDPTDCPATTDGTAEAANADSGSGET